MKFRISGLAATFAMVLTGAANAQVPTDVVGWGPAVSSEEAAEAVDALLAQLEGFASENNLQAFNAEMRGALEAYLPASMVVIPEDKADDETYVWTAGLHFESGYDVPVDGVLAPDPERPLYGDAQECSRANNNRSVAHFRRIRKGGMIGHICMIGFQNEDKAILKTFTLFEGGGRRGWTIFESVARVEGDPEAARALIEPVIEGNVALVEAFDAVMIRNLPLAAPNRPASAPAQP